MFTSHHIRLFFQYIQMAETEAWKIKRLIKTLSSMKGAGTSMISLIIPSGDQISIVQQMLTNEFGTASNIKSRVNRLSVLSAITSAQQRLKLYGRTPKNGLIIFVGTVMNDEGKERKIMIDFEPYKSIGKFFYMCDSRFHTEDLHYLVEQEQSFGFIVVDGNGALYAKVAGNAKETVYKFTVDLPKKHGRGGQSALRFARHREEARHNFVRKVCENAVNVFITNNKVNVCGIILAGSAEFKDVISQSDLLDSRLKDSIISIVDIAYGSEKGLNQAIELSQDSLMNLKFVKEKRVIEKFFEEISQDTNKYVYGIKDTMAIMESGALETLIVWEELEDTHEDKPLIEYFIDNHEKYGCTIELVSDKSEAGNQFVKGFGGVGGILRYAIVLDNDDIVEDEQLSSDDDDDFI